MKAITNIIYLALALFALACFALLPRAQAVMPPPDGNYPGGNTAEGFTSLQSLTTGAWNTALGYQTLYNDTTGTGNTATGFLALFSNTTGRFNTATATKALYSNTIGSHNTATGYLALFSNTTGTGNTANGVEALASNTIGRANTAYGGDALASNTTGFENTATGVGALLDNTTGRLNTAIGSLALNDNTTGVRNTAIGANALPFNDTGSDNIALGIDAGKFVDTANHVICIGSNGGNVSNSCFIGNIHGKTTQNADAIPVLIDSAGQLGTVSSSRRYKTAIKPMDKSSESILALKPVSFRYKVHKDTTPQFGLIAEEVAQVNPDLVIYNADGKPYTVRYEAVNAMLLNEFLKEHRKNAEQGATITRLEKQVEALNAGLQKVSAQLELSKSAPQTVLNNH